MQTAEPHFANDEYVNVSSSCWASTRTSAVLCCEVWGLRFSQRPYWVFEPSGMLRLFEGQEWTLATWLWRWSHYDHSKRPIHAPHTTCLRSILILSSRLRLFSKWLPSGQISPAKLCTKLSFSPGCQRDRPSHSCLFHHRNNNTWWGLQSMKLLHAMQSPSVPRHIVSLRPQV